MQQDLAFRHVGAVGPGGLECEVIGLDAAEHGLDGGGETKAFKAAGDGDQCFAAAGAACVAGAIEPGAGIERADDGAQNVEVGVGEGMLDEFQGAVEAAAVGPHLREGFRVSRGSGANALQRVRAPADLLEDCVVGDGAKFARVANGDGTRHAVHLAGGGA